jgi:hypothetical protein
MDLATLYFGGGGGASFKDGVSCGDFADADEQIVIAKSGFSIQKSIDGPTVGDTIFGMIVVPSVRRLHMDFEPDPNQTRATRLLSTRQAAKASIERVRYLTFGVARVTCLSGVVGVDSVGGAALETHPEGCE